MEPKPLADLPDVLTPLEAATVLRLGRNTTYENIRTGAIPSIKIGRKLLIPKSGILRLLEAAGQQA